MKWTRRQFLQLTGSAAAAIGLGIGVPKIAEILKGHISFNDWRALPGMVMTLTLDIDKPEQTEVEIIACAEGKIFSIEKMHGAPSLEVEMPFIETSQDSFELIAIVRDDCGHIGKSDPVEVITERFCFGM